MKQRTVIVTATATFTYPVEDTDAIDITEADAIDRVETLLTGGLVTRDEFVLTTKYGEQDVTYGVCQCHPDLHVFRNDPDPCIGFRAAVLAETAEEVDLDRVRLMCDNKRCSVKAWGGHVGDRCPGCRNPGTRHPIQ